MMHALPLAAVTSAQIIFVVIVAVLALPLLWFVHCGLHYCCFAHVRRYCRRNGFEVERWRSRPQFDTTGIKTEFWEFQLDCLDAQKQRRLISLSVWIFGVRKVLADESYPESLDDSCFRSVGD